MQRVCPFSGPDFTSNVSVAAAPSTSVTTKTEFPTEESGTHREGPITRRSIRNAHGHVPGLTRVMLVAQPKRSVVPRNLGVIAFLRSRKRQV